METVNISQITRLQPPVGKIPVVLDTDTYNEIDDQFALVYSLLSPERLNIQAIYAAPFFNSRSSSPQDGMEKSYEEICRILDKLDRSPGQFVFHGSTHFLSDDTTPNKSDAVNDLIERAMATTESPLYVIAIGAITNISSAILLEPNILERIVVIWLGGHALHWHHAKEFNLRQDVFAARLLFDCGVPVVHIPCKGVTTHLSTTVAEIERYVQGQGAIGDYLTQIFTSYHPDHFAWSKVLWDMAAVAYLINDSWVPTTLIHSPILTEQMTWSHDSSRHFIRYAYFVHRNEIFRDFFTKLAAYSQYLIKQDSVIPYLRQQKDNNTSDEYELYEKVAL